MKTGYPKMKMAPPKMKMGYLKMKMAPPKMKMGYLKMKMTPLKMKMRGVFAVVHRPRQKLYQRWREEPSEDNPNLLPVGDGFGFVFFYAYPNFNSKVDRIVR